MRVAMVIDEERLAQEQRLLNRLSVGLMAEGVDLVRIVPEGLHPPMDEGERRMGLAPRIEAPMKALRWMRSARVRRVVEAMQDRAPDVLYLLGSGAWTLGLDLARELDRPAVIDVWCTGVIPALPRSELHAQINLLLAPCAGIAEALRRAVGDEMVELVPMGVAAPRRARSPLTDAGRAPAIVVLGSSRDIAAYAAMFEGLAEVLKAHPALEIFVELRGRHEHEVWRAAQRLGLTGAVSAFGAAAAHRPLLMRCDVLLWPERIGELRSLLLEAMALALPVIASADPVLDMLIEGETAMLLREPAAEQWQSHLESALQKPQHAQAIGLRAREHVLRAHSSSAQVSGLIHVFERAGGRESYPFPDSPG